MEARMAALMAIITLVEPEDLSEYDNDCRSLIKGEPMLLTTKFTAMTTDSTTKYR